MRKTIKKQPSDTDDSNPSTEYQQTPIESMTDIQTSQESRSSRINDLINQMNIDNDGNNLVDFIPLKNYNETPEGRDYKSSMVLPLEDSNRNVLNLQGLKPLSYSTSSQQNNLSTAPLQVSSPFHIQQVPSNFTANTTDIAKLSNYNQSYDPPQKITNTHYSNLGLGNGNPDTKLMEKINYMIHMLEQQQGEQTQNITEEFILYTFLGVFVIFIVDSFARSGRYIR